MKTIAIIDIVTCDILTYYEDTAPNQGKFGGPWGWPQSTVHIALPAGTDREITIVRRNQDGAYIFEVDPTKEQNKIARLWTNLRSERNRILSTCDWTQLPDTPLAPETKAVWATYRQALRDFPSAITNIYQPTWPTAP